MRCPRSQGWLCWVTGLPLHQRRGMPQSQWQARTGMHGRPGRCRPGLFQPTVVSRVYAVFDDAIVLLPRRGPLFVSQGRSVGAGSMGCRTDATAAVTTKRNSRYGIRGHLKKDEAGDAMCGPRRTFRKEHGAMPGSTGIGRSNFTRLCRDSGSRRSILHGTPARTGASRGATARSYRAKPGIVWRPHRWCGRPTELGRSADCGA